MKSTDFDSANNARKISKLIESYFGKTMPVHKWSNESVSRMLSRVRKLIYEHKFSYAHHTRERNPQYLQLLMMEQMLSAKLKEDNVSKPIIDPNKLKLAREKLARKQPLSKDEQSLVNAASLAQQQIKERRKSRTLKESEIQQAQVVLAAQDMVDSVQGMIEDATEMQYKELPALVDSIRNQLGIEPANQFNSDAVGAMTQLVQSLQTAKQALEVSLGVVTGQQIAPALDAAINDGDTGDDMHHHEPGIKEPTPPEDHDTEPSVKSLGRSRRNR